jgi:PIN domain nuclease of toxin-antitoxin system
MRLLLDTHSFLWFIEDSPKLSIDARKLIEDDASEVLLSVGSLWEIAIKVSTGKLILARPFEIMIPQQLGLNRITLLDIAIGHAILVSSLPHHHKDPFDRLLIAQAIAEQLPIISIDTAFDNYGVTRLW